MQTTGKKLLLSREGHDVTILKVEYLSNGALAIHMTCCGIPEHAHTHNSFGLHEKSIDDLRAELVDVASTVADQHRGMLAATDHIRGLMGEDNPAPKHVSTMEIKR